MTRAQQGDEAPERSYVSSMFDDDSRYSGNLFVDTDLVTPMKSLWQVPGTRLKQFDSVLRILPGKRNDGRWSAFRTNPGKGQFGRWIYSAWAARSIGDPAVTFFLCSDADVQDHNYDPRQHPVYILYNAIYYAVEEVNKHVKPHWAPMVTSKQRKVIKKPGPMFLVQCLVYGRGDKIYDPPMGTEEGEKVVCFDLASDGGKTLRALLDQRKSRDELPESDEAVNFADYYKYGDITAFDGGKFVQLFPAGQNPNRDGPGPAAQGPRRSLSKAAVAESRTRAQQAIDSDRDKIGYEVAILDEYQGWEPSIAPDLAEALAAKIYPWPELIKVPDHKMAASYLWSRMRFGGELKLDVLLYAWRDHPDWLPPKDSDVWSEWVNRRQIAPRGYDPDAGEEDEDDQPAAAPQEDADRRPRRRAGDAAERADDLPRRRAGDAAERTEPAPAAPAPDDEEPPPQRGSRMVERQQTTSPPPTSPPATTDQEQPLRGRVSRSRPKPAQVEDTTVAADAIAGARAAPDPAANATAFRPSKAAAAAVADNDGEDRPATKTAGGFAAPPPSAAAPPVGTGKRDPKEILAAARASFTRTK
jgi:hypothetical protein